MSIDDRQLENIARRLGEAAGANIDVERTAQSVVARLQDDSGSSGRWSARFPVLGALAAAAVVVLVVGTLANQRSPRTAGEFDMAYRSVELEALSVDELAEVYDSLAFEAPVSEFAGASLEDMSVGQLEELLDTMMEE